MRNAEMFNPTRAAAIDKAMHFHSTFNRPAAPSMGGQYPYTPDQPRATPEDIIATAQKFLGFLLVPKATAQPRAKR